MVPSPQKNSPSVVDQVLVAVARFQHTGSLMNVNEEAARIFGLSPQSHMGLPQLREMLVRRGATAHIAMHIGDHRPVPGAAKVLHLSPRQVQRNTAISRWENEGGARMPIARRTGGHQVAGVAGLRSASPAIAN